MTATTDPSPPAPDSTNGTEQPPGPNRSRAGLWPLLARLHFYAGDPRRPVPGRRGADRPGLRVRPAARRDRLRRRADRRRGRRAPPGRWPSRSPPRAPRTPTAPSPRSQPGDRRRDHQGRASPCPSSARSSTPSTSTRTPARSAAQLTTWFGLDAADDLARRPAPQPAPGRRRPALLRAGRELAVGPRRSAGWSLWWRRQRGRRTRPARCSRPTWPPRKGVRRTRSWHAATGVWLAVGLLFLSATGLTWSRYAGEQLRRRACDGAERPTPRCSTPPAAGAGRRPRRRRHHDGGAAGAAAAVDPARHRHGARTSPATPGLAGPVEISLPGGRRPAPGRSPRSTTPGRSRLDRDRRRPRHRHGHRPQPTSPTGRCWRS